MSLFGEAGRPVLLDGAMATALHARGLEQGELPEHWLLQRPEEITAVHRAHVEAGAQVVLTCTFMTHPPNLRPSGLHSFCGEIRRVAVACARASGAPHVVGIVGPLSPELDAATVSFLSEAAAFDLVHAGVDALLVETITQPDEGVARTVGAAALGVPVIASVVPGTVAGAEGAALGERLRRAGASVLGVNCARPEACAPLLQAYRDAGLGPLWAKPSPGLPGAVMEEHAFAEAALALLDVGVAYLGGCCQTTARHLALMAPGLG